jgi:hypothetical protein
MPNPYVGYANIVPLLLPVDIGTTVTATPYVDLKGVNRCGFLLNFGVITTSTTASDVEEITVEAATIESGTEAAVAFSYRLSGLVTANTWGAITAVGATGVALTSGDDGLSVWVEIDPDAMAASDYRYVRVKLTDNTSTTVCLVAVNAFLDQIYRETTFVSATACASV